MLFRIEWFYRSQQIKKTFKMNSEYMTLKEALIVLQDLEKTGRLQGDVVFFDERESRWTKKEMIRYQKKHETEPHDVHAYIDGGFQPSSKESGIGIAVYYKQHQKDWRMRLNEQLDLLEDNNEAEYAALYRLFILLEELGVKNQRVKIHVDSVVVYNQASGQWPCYEENYIRWLDRIDEKVNRLGLELEFIKIDRSANKEADQLATQALNGIFIESNKEQFSDKMND